MLASGHTLTKVYKNPALQPGDSTQPHNQQQRGHMGAPADLHGAGNWTAG